jgi:nucleotide-binding universal stress UspA family protein
VARRLIIGYEESEQGEDALMLGQVLGEVLGAELLVVSVVVYPLGRGSVEAGLAVSGHSDQLREKVRDKIAGPVEARALGSNSAAGALNDVIDHEDPIAIVLGSGHHGPVGRVLVGSVGTALLSGARCPIAVAPRGYSKRSEHRLQQIGVAFNGSEESKAGLAAAVSLAERVHGSLTVLGSNEPLAPGYGTLIPLISEAEFEQSGQEVMARILDEAVQAAPSRLAIETRVLDGEAAGAIASAAEHLSLDLLVIGSRAYGPIRRVLLGGVASRLLRIAPCPVLVLPRGAGFDPLGFGAKHVSTSDGS